MKTNESLKRSENRVVSIKGSVSKADVVVVDPRKNKSSFHYFFRFLLGWFLGQKTENQLSRKSPKIFRNQYPEQSQNPFYTPELAANASYHGIITSVNEKKMLTNLATGTESAPLIYHLHSSMKGMVAHKFYPCPGPMAVFSKQQERFLVYNSFESCNIQQVAYDLMLFVNEYRSAEKGSDLTAIIVFAKEPKVSDVALFRKKLWRFLFRLSNEQNKYFEWAANYSPMTDDNNFALSFAGIALFLAAFHPASPRTSRRFGYPALIINPHEQFDKLKRDGYYEKWKASSRSKDIAIDGSINPVLQDFGDGSEWSSYDSGNIEPSVCPYKYLSVSEKSAAVSACPYKKFLRFLKRYFIDRKVI